MRLCVVPRERLAEWDAKTVREVAAAAGRGEAKAAEALRLVDFDVDRAMRLLRRQRDELQPEDAAGLPHR